MVDWRGRTIAERYRLEERLGRGSRGVVYRAHDEILGRTVAIKVFRGDAENAGQFRREAQVVARLQHPRIVPLFDFGRWEHKLFFTMPVVRGESLRQVLRRGSLEPPRVIEIGSQLADALAYSHARGIVHRDLKPENVMVEWAVPRRPQVSLLDFGIALEVDGARVAEPVFRGTALYASPEQLSSDTPVDARSDIWSLGVVLYECLAGISPFRAGRLEGVFFRILTQDPPPFDVEGLVPAFEQLVLNCLRRDRAERPASMDEVSRRLRELGAERPAPSAASSHDLPDWFLFRDRPPIDRDYRDADRAFDAVRRASPPRATVIDASASRRRLAFLTMRLGHYEEAVVRCDEALALAGGEPANRARAQCVAVLILVTAGDLDAARARLAAARAELERLGAASSADEVAIEVLRASGNLELARGRPAVALDQFLEALERVEASGEPTVPVERWRLSIHLYNAAEALYRWGDVASAERHLDRAEALKAALGDRWGMAYLSLLRARMLLAAGRIDRAAHQASLAESIAEAIRDPKTIALSLLLRADVAEARGDSAALDDALRRALAVAERAGCRPEADEALSRLRRSTGGLLLPRAVEG
ncbi:MAG: serine/threonine-protein kinase [Acidobacteriota bacterium]